MTSDIKQEIKINNSTNDENKNFFISVPKDEISRINDLDERLKIETPNNLKRKRDEN